MDLKDIFLDLKSLAYKFFIPCVRFETSSNEREKQRAELCHRAVTMQVALVVFI